jgi:Mg/Co/Ni transporter MgtE
MQPTQAAAVLEVMAPQKAASALNAAPSHARSLLIRALAPAVQTTILKAAPRRQAAVLSRYLSYDPDSVGAWMDVPSAAFNPDVQVSEVLRQLRHLGRRLSPNVFVVDGARQLLGMVELDALLAADDDDLLGMIMSRDPKTISPQARLQSVVLLDAWDRTLALPVTDAKRRLVGSLRFDALREGLAVQHGKSFEMGVNIVLMHMAQAFLVSVSGLLQVAATKPRLTRLSGESDRL